jgi:hypothetical protein
MKDEPDSNRADNSNAAAEMNDTPAPARPAAKKSKWLWIALIILLILLLLIFGWLWRKDRDGKNGSGDNDGAISQANNGENGDAEEPACAAGLTNYENEELGFGFCYPPAWGDVTVNDARFLSAPEAGVAADTGSRWRLGFTAKEMVNLGVVSADWSTQVGREGTCVDPAQSLPPFAPFSTAWATEDFGDSEAASGSRGIEVLADHYLLREFADNLLTNGVCLEGFTVINGTYPHTSASYSAEFGGAITTPQQHMDTPDTLISAANRIDFAAFVKSVRRLE